MDYEYQKLNTSYQIGKVKIKNRFAMAPMGQGENFGPYGEFSQRGISYFEERA